MIPNGKRAVPFKVVSATLTQPMTNPKSCVCNIFSKVEILKRKFLSRKNPETAKIVCHSTLKYLASGSDVLKMKMHRTPDCTFRYIS